MAAALPALDPEYQRAGGWRNLRPAAPILCFYIAACVFVITHLSERAWDVGRHFLLALGALQIWRVSTMLIHVIRALIYQFHAFPKLRKAADALPSPECYPRRFCFIIPTYRERSEVTQNMLRSVLREALLLPCPVSLYAATGGPDEDRVFIEELERWQIPSSRVELVLLRQKGKRLGMAYALRAMARDGVDANTLVALMDGDTLLGPDLLRRTLPFFKLFPKLGALTTDNIAVTTGARWYSQWYDLRFSMRHRYMKSVSLSRKVLTLTGRFSVFRSDIAVSDEFLSYLEDDAIEDWFYGRIKFVTGDDKSTWFALLKNRWEMLYIPDAYTVCVEDSSDHPGAQAFAKMFRWFGNMLRNNGRAIALGPRTVGLFPWWCLVDQRLSIWTTLVGPCLAVILSFTSNIYYLIFYLVMASARRIVYLAILVVEGHVLRLMDLPLLMFTDWAGAFMKMTVLADLKNQRWAARESKSDKAKGDRHEAIEHFLANYRRGLSWAIFTLGVLYYARVRS